MVQNGPLTCRKFIPFPNDKILNQSKFKALAVDKINMTEKMKFIFGGVENSVGKGQNAGYQHFLLFPQCFQKTSYTGVLKGVILWQKVKDSKTF